MRFGYQSGIPMKSREHTARKLGAKLEAASAMLFAL